VTQSGPSVEEVLCRYTRDVYRYLLFLCGDRRLAEDLTQETLCRALASTSGFTGKSTILTWLFAIARNTALTALKRRAREARVVEDGAARLARSAFQGQVTPETVVLEAEQRDRLRSALAGLSERHRTLIVLREYWELPYSQIAEATGLSLASVKKNLYLARAALRQAFLDGANQGEETHGAYKRKRE